MVSKSRKVQLTSGIDPSAVSRKKADAEKMLSTMPAELRQLGIGELDHQAFQALEFIVVIHSILL